MLAIGCDHGGYELKQEILKYLEKEGYEVKDFGCFSTASGRLSGNRPTPGLAHAVADGVCEKGNSPSAEPV